jgi:hypothetical protein
VAGDLSSSLQVVLFKALVFVIHQHQQNLIFLFFVSQTYSTSSCSGSSNTTTLIPITCFASTSPTDNDYRIHAEVHRRRLHQAVAFQEHK